MVAAKSISNASSTSLWGLPVESQRLKRKPAKVWIKGKQGFRVGRRKTGLKQNKSNFKMTKSEYINSQKKNARNHGVKPEMGSHESKIKVPIRLSIPKKGENFVDFGNSWKHEDEDGKNLPSVKVKRKKDPSRVLPKKGKHMKSPKSHDRKHAKTGGAKSYRVKNEDGSITWGYVSSDGSYKVRKII